jgi:hypothetical protein
MTLHHDFGGEDNVKGYFIRGTSDKRVLWLGCIFSRAAIQVATSLTFLCFHFQDLRRRDNLLDPTERRATLTLLQYGDTRLITVGEGTVTFFLLSQITLILTPNNEQRVCGIVHHEDPRQGQSKSDRRNAQGRGWTQTDDPEHKSEEARQFNRSHLHHGRFVFHEPP